jgi:hypothetical protein
MSDITSMFNLEAVLDPHRIRERELCDEFVRRLNSTFDVVKELMDLSPDSLGQLGYHLTRQGTKLTPTDPAARMTLALAAALLVSQACTDLDQAALDA